ncbi:MAG TPA: peptidylprolyl isomerase [Blastocatellia bacterium]|nr:peptidylprolyl isomerase [Blastocatellia bacterium]
MKSFTKLILILALVANLLATQSCALFSKSEFVEVTADELAALADTLPESQKRQLAQSKVARDQLMGQFKTPFALAQAAEAEGLHKTDQFKQELAFASDRLLATEYTKRNPDTTLTKEEKDAFLNSNKAKFDSFFTFLTRDAKQAPSDNDKEMMRDQWSEIQLRAQKGRDAGIEKEPSFKIQIKIAKASVLANAFSKSLEAKLKMTPEEKKRYIAEHPEADLDKIKEKAESLKTRVKNGEDFEKIAKEFNDGTTRDNGGELPWFDKEGKVDGSPFADESLAAAAFTLEKGGISDIIKTRYGFHVIKLEDKRIYDPSKDPKKKDAPAPTPPPSAQPTPSPTPQAPQEQVRTRQIFLSTDLADSFEQEETDKKVKRAVEDATLKYPVKIPADFIVKVGGYDPNKIPGLGSGQGGTMKGIDPNANK